MNIPAQNITPEQNMPPAQPVKKKRHGCLTTWLILIIIANIVITFIDIGLILSDMDEYPGWAIPVDVIIVVWVVVCAIAIFMWKKWGFYGFVGSAVIQAIVSIIVGNYFGIAQPFIAVAFLYGVLQIGKDNKGWPQLE